MRSQDSLFPAKSKTLIPKTANSVLGSCVCRKATNGNNIISLRLVILQIDIVWKKFKQVNYLLAHTFPGFEEL